MDLRAWSKAVLAGLLAIQPLTSFYVKEDIYPNCGYAYQEPHTCGELTIQGEWLLFRAREDNLSIGKLLNIGELLDGGSVAGAHNGITVAFDPVRGQQQYLEPKWSSGYRLWASYRPACMTWDFAFGYTHYTTKAYKSIVSSAAPNPFSTTIFIGTLFESPLALSPGFDAKNLGNSVRSGDASLHLQINDYQGNFYLPIEVGNCFTLKPFIGVKGAQISQKMNSDYTNVYDIPASVLSYTEQSFLAQKSTYHGVGLQGGTYAQYELGWDLSLFSSVDVALLYGKHRIKGNVIQNVVEVDRGIIDESQTTTHINEGPYLVRPAFDASFGVKWTSPEFFGMQGVVQASWEHHIYFKQNNFRTNFSEETFDMRANRRLGDLSLFGAVISAKLVF